MRALRAVLFGAGAVLLRLSREGMVLRALAWPGLLAAGATLLTVLLVTRGGTRPTEQPSLALDPTELLALGPALLEQGITARPDPEPEGAVAAGRADRAAWREGGGWVLAAPTADAPSLRIEALLRAEVGTHRPTWQLEVPAEPPRKQAVEAQSGRIGSLVSVLFALYGVVMGAGLAWRDRGEGVVEATLPLPVPAWTHGAARILALGLAMAGGLVATLLLLHGFFGLASPGRAMLHGALGGATASAAGLASVGGAGASRRGFSGPLSRGMAIVAALLGLGFGLPSVGAALPIASLAAAGAGTWATDLLALGLGGLAMALAAAWWGRGQGGLGR